MKMNVFYTITNIRALDLLRILNEYFIYILLILDYFIAVKIKLKEIDYLQDK